MFERIISEQLRHPSGLIGRHLLPIIWNKRNVALNDAALTRLQVQPGDSILDVGCGGGYLIGRVAGQAREGLVSGVDASPDIIAYCHAKFARSIKAGCLDLRHATVGALPYPNDHFNKVCSVNSLFYWPDVSQGIREIYRVLSASGLFVLVYTCKHDLDRRGFSRQAVRSFTDEEVTGVLKKEGFHDVLAEQRTDSCRRFSIVSGSK